MSHPLAWYREFVPCGALQADVYAFFSFVPGHACPPKRGARTRILSPPARPLLREVPFGDTTFCSPQFADGHVSIVFELGQTVGANGRWCADSTGLRGTIVGPMSGVGRTEGGDRPEMIGIYFRPARAASFLRVAMSDLTDKAVAVGDLWGSAGARLASMLSDLDEAARIDCLESVLLDRFAINRPRTGSIDMERLAASVLCRRGRVRVGALARACGVSRQHLSRRFRERFGIAPKLYCRLARFQSGLVFAGRGAGVDWAQAAVDVGYADQSHMIAEFRQFSGLTPQALASGRWFHPFIERAKSVHMSNRR